MTLDDILYGHDYGRYDHNDYLRDYGDEPYQPYSYRESNPIFQESPTPREIPYPNPVDDREIKMNEQFRVLNELDAAKGNSLTRRDYWAEYVERERQRALNDRPRIPQASTASLIQSKRQAELTDRKRREEAKFREALALNPLVKVKQQQAAPIQDDTELPQKTRRYI